MLRAEEEAVGDIALKDVMVGKEASDLRNLLQISYPVENGIVRNWDDMEHVWNHTFHDKFGINVKVRVAVAAPRGLRLVVGAETTWLPRCARCRRLLAARTQLTRAAVPSHAGRGCRQGPRGPQAASN